MKLGVRNRETLPAPVSEDLEAMVRAIITAWSKEHSMTTDGHVTLTVDGQTVSLGAADSGGVGYKLLRVPN